MTIETKTCIQIALVFNSAVDFKVYVNNNMVFLGHAYSFNHKKKCVLVSPCFMLELFFGVLYAKIWDFMVIALVHCI